MSDYLNRFKLSSHFSLSEFACPCCSTVKLEPYLINSLQALRYAINKRIVVTSGYRCNRHNTEIHGVPESRHLLGQAADIIVSGVIPTELVQLAYDIGFEYVKYDSIKKYYHLQIKV